MAVKLPSQGKRIDWSEMIFNLERCGMSQRQIGLECGLDPENGHVWVNRLKNIPGTQPKFHDGAMLLGLWAEKMAKAPAEAPLEV